MLKYTLKQWSKKSRSLYIILSWIIKSYLSLTYCTIRWSYILPSGYQLDDFNRSRKKIFAMWHNNLAIAPYAFRKYKNLYSLVSPHADGRIISSTLRRFGYHIIEGSTNKNPATAVKQIIHQLAAGNNIAITPDGPRGPIYKINSNIVRIAKIAQAEIIPISCRVKKYWKLGSWDGLMIPLPFSVGIITIDNPLILSDNDELSTQILENMMNNLRCAE